MRMAALLLGAGAFPGAAPGDGESEARWTRQRQAMVDKQIAGRGVRDERVLAAMRAVPRHVFVPESERHASYEDRPLRIGSGQTISQPYIVALMTEALRLRPGDRVLEIGTGSGYQAAVLAAIPTVVYSIEIVPELAAMARAALSAAGVDSVQLRTGDGYRGWPEAAPFDAIVVTAAPGHVPPALVEQLQVGGRMVLPVGSGDEQELLRLVKTASGVEREMLAPVRFVPMTGEAARKPIGDGSMRKGDGK
jgi:protein-L-isoaspartate(D-aspartate) O-methyltransferase